MLRDRELYTLILGGGIAALILIVSLVVIPSTAKMKSLSRAKVAALADLADIRRLKPGLAAIEKEVSARTVRLKATSSGADSPATRLSAIVEESGLPASACSIKSAGTKDGDTIREASFDLRAENLTFHEASRLLSRLETGAVPLVVRSVQLKSRFDDPRYVDASIRVGCLSPLPR